MPKQRLTDRQLISGVTLTDLLHFVVTGDTSQSPAGSSYKGNVGQLFDSFSAYTCTNPLTLDVVNACTTGITINGNVVINGSATTINTEVIQSKDNNIVLNYSGTHLTAIGGGITLEDGQSNGVDSRIYTDSNGTWLFDPGLSASTGTINDFTANTISVTTIGNSGDCVNDLYVSNIHSCSPLNINPLDEGNVYFGATSGLTIDVTNSRLGIGTTTPTEKLDVSGNTKISGSLNIGTILSGTPLINLGLDSSGNVVTGTTWDGGSNYIIVKAQGTDTENAAELQAAYDLAQTLSPLSGNVITIIAAPGYYNFGSSEFKMDTPYIDLVSLDGNRNIIFNSTLNSTSFSARTEGSINITSNNISVKGVDVLDKNFTVASNLNSILIENCRGGDYSFGGVEDGGTPIVVSGEFINCIGGDLSFGGNGTASGIFKNCEGADFSFAGAQTTGGFATGRFSNCVGGDESYGFTLLNGEFIDCVGGEFSFGFAGSIEISTFENCVGDNFTFGSFGLIDTTTFENCRAGDSSFCGSGIYIFLSEINNSKGGDFSFGSNIQIIFDSEFNNCIGGLDSFGKDFTVSNDGRFYRCRLTDGTFDTPDAGGFIILGIDGDNSVQNITGV